MYFLSGLPANPYAGDKSVIDILSALFGALWNGLLRVPVPGLSFSFAMNWWHDLGQFISYF